MFIVSTRKWFFFCHPHPHPIIVNLFDYASTDPITEQIQVNSTQSGGLLSGNLDDNFLDDQVIIEFYF